VYYSGDSRDIHYEIMFFFTSVIFQVAALSVFLLQVRRVPQAIRDRRVRMAYLGQTGHVESRVSRVQLALLDRLDRQDRLGTPAVLDREAISVHKAVLVHRVPGAVSV